MEIVIKTSAIAAVSAICILLIKKNNGEIGLAVAIAAAAVICFAAYISKLANRLLLLSAFCALHALIDICLIQ